MTSNAGGEAVHVYSMTFNELAAANRSLRELVDDVRDERPEAALLLLDAMELACRELLVRAVGGDRELATRLFNEAHGGH